MSDGIDRSASAAGEGLASAARAAVRDAWGPDALRLLLIDLTPRLAAHFGGDASRALGALIEARDRAVAEHHHAVEAAATRLARTLELESACIARIAACARFFDVGKLFVAREILYADGPLDRESWPLVRRHVYEGWTIASAIPALANLAPIVRAHHERPDGHGYPDGLPAHEIPLEAAVLAVADAWVSIVSSRSYRSPMTIREAVLVLEDGRGVQWDLRAVDALLSFVVPRKLKRGSPAAARTIGRAAGIRTRRS